MKQHANMGVGCGALLGSFLIGSFVGWMMRASQEISPEIWGEHKKPAHCVVSASTADVNNSTYTLKIPNDWVARIENNRMTALFFEAHEDLARFDWQSVDKCAEGFLLLSLGAPKGEASSKPSDTGRNGGIEKPLSSFGNVRRDAGEFHASPNVIDQPRLCSARQLLRSWRDEHRRCAVAPGWALSSWGEEV